MMRESAILHRIKAVEVVIMDIYTLYVSVVFWYVLLYDMSPEYAE